MVALASENAQLQLNLHMVGKNVIQLSKSENATQSHVCTLIARQAHGVSGRSAQRHAGQVQQLDPEKSLLRHRATEGKGPVAF